MEKETRKRYEKELEMAWQDLEIVQEYANYCMDYADYRADIEQYPACFNEWYLNDYQENN